MASVPRECQSFVRQDTGAMRLRTDLKDFMLFAYGVVVNVVVAGLIFLMLAVLLFSFVNVATVTYHMIPLLKTATFEEADFRLLVEDLLDVFIVIELFDVFADYVRTKAIHISNLLDIAVVFTLREILVKLYAQRFSVNDLIGLCVIAFSLVVSRSIAGRFPPRRNSRIEGL